MLFLPPPNGDFIQRGEDLSLPVSICGRKRRPNKKKNFFLLFRPSFFGYSASYKRKLFQFSRAKRGGGKGEIQEGARERGPAPLRRKRDGGRDPHSARPFFV